MSARAARRRDELLLVAVAAAATAVAIASTRAAVPPSPGIWMAAAAALTLGLAGLLALWLGGAPRKGADDALFGEWDAARAVLSAVPDGLFLVSEGRVSSVNRRLCELLGFDREELLGSAPPFPFWPPEHRHEIEAWHAELGRSGACEAEVTFRHRDGTRLRVLLAGRTVAHGTSRHLVPHRDRAAHGASRHLVTVRDVSGSHRRERRLADLSSRDPETGLLNRREFEERLGEAVLRATKSGGNVTVVLAELAVDGRGGEDVFRRPEALVAVERLQAHVRAEDALARTRESELAWILPDTDAHGGVGAVARARTALAALEAVSFTVGICDLATAGDALALYAFADRALESARRRGVGATVQYASPPPLRRRDAVGGEPHR